MSKTLEEWNVLVEQQHKNSSRLIDDIITRLDNELDRLYMLAQGIEDNSKKDDWDALNSRLDISSLAGNIEAMRNSMSGSFGISSKAWYVKPLDRVANIKVLEIPEAE